MLDTFSLHAGSRGKDAGVDVTVGTRNGPVSQVLVSDGGCRRVESGPLSTARYHVDLRHRPNIVVRRHTLSGREGSMR